MNTRAWPGLPPSLPDPASVPPAASARPALGAPRLLGPFVVDYTDIPHNADRKTLWVPQTGDVLLRLLADWQTVTQWDHGTLYIGQNVDGTVAPPLNSLAFAAAGSIGKGTTGSLDSVSDPISFTQTDASGASIESTAYIFHRTDPVQIQLAQTGGTDPTRGHVEVYALVARAVAP